MGKIICIFLIIPVVLISGCATVFSKQSYPVNLKSAPEGASFSIKNSYGTELLSGKTPAVVELDASEGFFEKARYRVIFEKEGYMPKEMLIENDVDGWFIAGIFLGGLVSIVVDGATGAMYKIKTRDVNANLNKSTASLNKNGLRFYSLDQIPDHWKPHLEKISDAE